MALNVILHSSVVVRSMFVYTPVFVHFLVMLLWEQSAAGSYFVALAHNFSVAGIMGEIKKCGSFERKTRN